MKKKIIWLLNVLFILLNAAHAQLNSHLADTTKQLDLIDIGQHIIKKHPAPRQDSSLNPKGKIHIGAFPAAGYTLQTGFAGVVSANAAFFTTAHNHDSENISTVLTSIAYTANSQIIFPIQTFIWGKDNNILFISDWRFLKYPSTTYGLGGHTHISDGYDLDYSYIKLHQAILWRVYKKIYAGVGYDYDHFWNIREILLPGRSKTDFENYGFSPKETASGISLNFVYDTRRNPINPLNGMYANIIFRPKFEFLGSTNNWQSLLIEWRGYKQVPANSNNVFALWSYNWFTVSGKPPYLLLPSTGWDMYSNTGRGYIQGRFRGKNMLDEEAEYRFQITRNGLLGAVLFANAQSFSDIGTGRYETIAPGAGIGIRVKLNKFSRTNLALDYGWGNEGSKGFFVNLGEVF